MNLPLSLSWFALAAMLSLAACAGAGEISMSSLLDDMTNLSAMAEFPSPPYVTRQFSSYDRASTSPANKETWFANYDRGQYIRVEERAGHKEYVMADMPGPGALVRVWSPNPGGTLRIYIDGAEKPVLEGPMADLLGGKHPLLPRPLAVEVEGVHPEDLQRCLETYRGAFDARQQFQMEYRLRRGDGEHRWITDTGIPQYSGDGGFLGYIGTCVEIPGPRPAKANTPLTAREIQVLTLVAEGKSTKEVAALLNISYKTADSHRSRIMEKLGVHETASLVRYAIRHGIVSP